MFKKIKNRIIKIICFFLRLDKDYELRLLASSISFYMLLALISLISLFFQILTRFSSNLQNLLIVKVLEIFNEKIGNELVSLIPDFAFSSGSIFLIINFLWSSSKVISGLNRASYKIFSGYKHGFFLISRLKSMLVFAILMILIIFEYFIAVSSNYFILSFFQDYYLLAKVLQILLELLIIFIIMMFINIYIPPIKLGIKSAFRGAFMSTILYYLLLSLFIAFISFYNKINVAYTLYFFVTITLLMIFLLNYIILLGMIINQRLNIPSIKVTPEQIIKDVNNT